MTPQQVVDLMKSSRSEKEWNANCDKVKATCGGDYPDFWFDVIIQSGVLWTTAANFGKSADIHISSF